MAKRSELQRTSSNSLPDDDGFVRVVAGATGDKFAALCRACLLHAARAGGIARSAAVIHVNFTATEVYKQALGAYRYCCGVFVR